MTIDDTRLALPKFQGPLDDLRHKLSSEEGERWLSAFKQFLRKENPWAEPVSVQVSRFVPTLGERRSVDLPQRIVSFDPATFYQSGKGLHVWEGFRDRILPVARMIEKAPAITIGSCDFLIGASDADIRGSLPKNYLFEDASLYSAHLAGMIERQANGEDGYLLTEGHANVFYVSGVGGNEFPVCVRWDSGKIEWDINALPLGFTHWPVGGRVFSYN
jgi:hypothetical protein